MQRSHIAVAGALLTALLMAASFPPLDLRFLAPIALVPLLYALADAPSWQWRLATGWLCGFVYWALACYWIRDVLFAYGGLTGTLSWVALGLFGLFKGLQLAVFAAVTGPLLARPWGVLAVAALWTGIERTHAPLAFPWLLLGNAGIDMAFPLRLAPWLGVYGISFLFAAVAAAITHFIRHRNRRVWIWLAPILLMVLLPRVVLKTAPTFEAVAVQANIPADGQWTPEAKDRAIRDLSLLTLQSALDPARPKPELLLWPEAPAPFYYYEDATFRGQVSEVARLSGTPFFIPSVAFTPGKEPLNSVVVLDPRGRLIGRYDKMFLVPFGEFVPQGFGWIRKISAEAGDFAPGAEAKGFVVNDHKIGAFVCYESAFPHLARRFVDDGAEALVNLSNDGYFGHTSARAQHLLLARMRAVENARWLLRATNDGITAAIDPAGRVWDEQPEKKRLAARLRFGWASERTFYTRTGDWFAWSCLVVGLALSISAMRQREDGV